VAATKKLRLNPAWGVDEALKRIVRDVLPRLESGERGVLETDDSKYVHRSRVALRRIRSALKLYGGEDATASDLRAGLSRIAQLLGSARDWDVLLEDTLPRLGRAYGKSATFDRIVRIARAERESARAEAAKALVSPYYRALRGRLARWLGRSRAPGGSSVPLKTFAAKSIGKRYKRLLHAGRDLADKTRAQRHGVRLEAKRLRYTVEFLESLFGRGLARPCLRELVLIQDALGAAEDTRTAVQLFTSLHPGSDVARFAREWLAVREQRSVAAAQRAIARLAREKRFWKARS
jgi:CHAD domain-containing protein